jgi:hypothetical protein
MAELICIEVHEAEHQNRCRQDHDYEIFVRMHQLSLVTSNGLRLSCGVQEEAAIIQ